MSYLKNKIKKFFNKELIIYSNIKSDDTIIATIPLDKLGNFTFNDISNCLIKKGMKDFNYYTEINKVKQSVSSTSDIHLSKITSGYIIVLNMYLSIVERIGYYKYIKNKNTNNISFKKYINNLSQTIQHKEINAKLKSLITKLQEANQEGNYEKFKKELIENYEKSKANKSKTNPNISSSIKPTSNSNTGKANNGEANIGNANTGKANNSKINPNISNSINPSSKANTGKASNSKTNLNISSSNTVISNNPKPKTKTIFQTGNTAYWYSSKNKEYKFGTLGNKRMYGNLGMKYNIINPRFYKEGTKVPVQSAISENILINENNIIKNK